MYNPSDDVAAEPVGGLCTRQRGRDGVGRDMEPGEVGAGAANREKGDTSDDAASGEDAGVMSRATPSAGRPWMAGG